METQAWVFRTRNLIVELMVRPCDVDPADSFEFPEDIEVVRSGAVEWFDARLVVSTRDGVELGSDSLGCCAYEKVSDFYEDHRDPDPMNRNSSIMRAANGDNVVICHYFPGMVAEACAEARATLRRLRTIPARGEA